MIDLAAIRLMLNGIDDIEYANSGPGDVYGGGRWVFNGQPFHIVVNLALTGNVGVAFPQSLLIDWIRVYSAVRPQHQHGKRRQHVGDH
jgi:hypothetical protein